MNIIPRNYFLNDMFDDFEKTTNNQWNFEVFKIPYKSNLNKYKEDISG